jgi:hypothetical protein
MLKKIAVTVLILAIITSLVVGYFYIKNHRMPTYDAIQAVPIDAAIIIKSQNTISKLNQLKKSNEIWSELKQLPAFGKFDSDINFLADFTNQYPVLLETLNNREILLSIHRINQHNAGVLYLIPLTGFREKKVLLNVLKERIGFTQQLQQRNFGSNIIFHIQTGESLTDNIYFSFTKGMLLVSSASILLENAIRQAGNSESLKNDHGFLKVAKTEGKNVDANVYINFNHLPELLALGLNEENKEKIIDFNYFGDWAELDLSFKVDAILLNGFTFSNALLNNYLNIFLQQQAVEHKMNSILPSNTSLFLSFGISNTEKYIDSYKKYIEKLSKKNPNTLLIEQFKKTYAIDLEKDFLSLIDQEVGFCITEINDSNYLQNSYTIMQVKGKSIAANALESILARIAETEKKKKSDYIKEKRIDKETAYLIYKFPAQNLFANFFGNMFSGLNHDYCTFVDNYLVFSNSEEALLKFIYANILKKTLEFDMKFSQFTEFLSSRSNFYFYCNTLKSPQFIKGLLNDNLQKGYTKNIESFKKFQAFAVQFSRSNEMIYNNLFLKYIPDTKAEAITVWESRLDTIIDFKPCLVTNHYSKENEIFVQDINNKIYLINKVGRVLWRIQLNEKINSDIYQVDFYKNGKLQLLFSTENQIHLIDRNGNYVERYPIKLRSSATAGLSVFDYEKNRDYRILIPCKNRNIYAYDILGDLINGWSFQQSDKLIKTPIEHYKINTNDYLVFADSYRVYILNRKGEERIKIKNQFIKSTNNRFNLEIESPNPRLVTTDTSGTIKMIYFDGKVEETIIRRFSSKHYFDFQDIDADGVKDFIFVDDNMLEVYKQNGTKIFDYTFNEPITLILQPISIFLMMIEKLVLFRKHRTRYFCLITTEHFITAFLLKEIHVLQ